MEGKPGRTDFMFILRQNWLKLSQGIRRFVWSNGGPEFSSRSHVAVSVDSVRVNSMIKP